MYLVVIKRLWLFETVNSVLYRRHAGISAQRLSDLPCADNHTPLPEFKAGPAETNRHESKHTVGEEALKTPDKKGPLSKTNNINYK
jgi:hypothetical protein